MLPPGTFWFDSVAFMRGPPSCTKWTHVTAGGMNQSIPTPTLHNLSRLGNPGASMHLVRFFTLIDF